VYVITETEYLSLQQNRILEKFFSGSLRHAIRGHNFEGKVLDPTIDASSMQATKFLYDVIGKLKMWGVRVGVLLSCVWCLCWVRVCAASDGVKEVSPLDNLGPLHPGELALLGIYSLEIMVWSVSFLMNSLAGHTLTVCRVTGD